MAFVNAAMAPPPLQTSNISRRRGDHHPNLWDDSFIQSLSSPYSASSYHERRETLINEIKGMLLELGKVEPDPTANKLLQRFWIVDVVQCLGIGRHFQNEIKLVLDWSYKHWKEEGITLNLNTTALGFRTLRLNGYPVSADAFNNFKGEDGRFSCSVATKETHCELRSMLSLHRAAEIVFPGESIMKEANIFTTKYLQAALKEWKEDKNQLIMEVENALKYPWKCNVPRLEARNYIEIIRQDNTSNMKIKDGFDETFLELAILDFNILQCQHQSELKQVSRWWTDSNARNLDIFRHRHVEYYFWCASGLFEAELGASRVAFSKLCTMCTLLDDIYDTYGTLDELEPFTSALISREISALDNLPGYMKVTFKFVLEILEEIEEKMEAKQGHNLKANKYAHDLWKNYILSYFQEAQWIASNHTPTLDEYLKNAFSSAAVGFIIPNTLLMMDNILFYNIFKKIDFPSSKFQTLTPIVGRLLDDSQDLQEEEDRGESCSSLLCFKRDNPGSTNEDALNYANNHVELYMEDLTKEFLESYHIPACFKNFQFHVGVRGVFFMYHFRDGYSFADKEIKNTIDKILIEPLPL